MKKEVLKLLLNCIQIYLFGGLSSLLLLIYLVITDSYFYNLDFKLEKFKIKIEDYLLFTFTIPIVLMLVFSLILYIKSDPKTSKLIVFSSSLLGLMIFIAFDNTIKKALFYSENILLGLIVTFFIYVLLFLIVSKKERKLIVDINL